MPRDLPPIASEIELARPPESGWRLEPAQAILAALLLLEIAVFSVIGTNFLTLANAFEVLRLSVEIGLLAVALTPVITSGGIDLSVGSLMGLSAVVFGKLWRDGGLPIGAAAAATLVLGALAGSVNGLLDHPWAGSRRLIVTLGSFSLFRGLAEGLDRRRGQLHQLPRARSCSWARAIRWAAFPTQVPIFVVVAAAFWVLLHRTTVGRGLVGDRLLARGCPIRRAAGRPAGRPGVRALGPGRQPGGDHLRGPPGPGQGRRRHRLRAGGDHGRRAGRHVDLRRPRERPRDAAGPVRHRRAPQRPAAGRPARRAGRRLDRNASAWSRSGWTAKAGRRAPRRGAPPIHPRR